MSCLLLVDVNNLYHGVQSKFGNRRLMILQYTRFLEEKGYILSHKIAYSHQKPESCIRFLSMLQNNGFECHFGNKSIVAMALRAADLISGVDTVIVGSTDFETGRILHWASKTKKAVCFGVDVPFYFTEFAHAIEVTEELLSAVDPSTKPLDMPTNIAGDGS